jgi:glutaredoxin
MQTHRPPLDQPKTSLGKKQSLSTTLLLAASIVLAQHALAEPLYKWVDKNGNVSYQENPPTDSSISHELIKAPPAESRRANAGEAEKDPVLVYTIAECEACVQVIDQLEELDIPVAERSLLDREVQTRILDSGGKLAAPTVFINDKLVLDFSFNNLRAELVAAGYLAESNDADTSAEQTDNEPIQ